MLYTHTHLTTQRCVSSQALFPQMEGHIHTPGHKHTHTHASLQDEDWSAVPCYWDQTHTHTHSIFLSTRLQLGVEHKKAGKSDNWEARDELRVEVSSLSGIQGHIETASKSALTRRIVDEARVLVQQRSNLCDKQKTTRWLTNNLQQMCQWLQWLKHRW